MNCSLCQGTRSTTISRTDCKSRLPLPVHLCGDCGLIQQAHMPTTDELKHYYASEYRMDYKGTWRPKPKHVHRSVRQALRRCDFLRSCGITGGRLLDIGAGSGEFVFICRHRGFRSRGAEPNLGYSSYAREEYGVEMLTQELAEVEGVHDIITLFHVMEHLPSPRDVFAHLHGLLAPGGVLFIEVPWGLSPTISPVNRYFKAHLHYFERETLAACASGHFDVISSRQDGNLSMLLRRREITAPLQLPPPGYATLARQRALRLGWWSYLADGKALGKPLNRLRRMRQEHGVRHLRGSSIIGRALEDAAA